MSAGAPPRRIALASGNPHKALEWQALLTGWSVETLDMQGAPPESGKTFSENALVKARHGAARADQECWVLGEDSGLAVEALGGAPGVRSARFAGPDATDADNVEQLLHVLIGVQDRRARFLCAAACIGPRSAARPKAAGGTRESELSVEGLLDGSIALGSSGAEGFGYDPVFIPTGEAETVAQLGNDWKLLNSHRARTARALLGLLHRW